MIGTILRIRYELAQELDAGPVMTLYRARDRVGGRDVFIRLFNAPFRKEVEFLDGVRETLKRMSSVQNPSVERFLELDEDEGETFLVSEGLSGQLLSDRIKRLAPFSAPVAIQTALGLLEGLQALHAAGCPHGDVRPKNVFVSPEGRTRLLLPGFWQAYGTSQSAGSLVLPLMSPYLAPETSSGAMPDQASDVYAVGTILYELLIGRLPFSADSPSAMALKHATAPVPSLRASNASIPAVLEEIVKKSIAKSTSDRYSSASEMIRDLRMMQDAMRFGKQLTWPIVDAPQSTPLEPNPVAPKMSAVREPEELVKKPQREVEMSDNVPKWLSWMFYLGVCAVVLMAGGFVYWNLTKPRTLKVPNIVGLTANDASARLSDIGLLMKISKKTPDESKPEGTVLSSSPEKGADIREKGYVRVVLSAGSRWVLVPDVKGKSIDDAKNLIAQLDLSLEEPTRKEYSTRVPVGGVISQTPDPKQKVERYSRIKLVVSQGRDQREPIVESDQQYEYSIKVPVPEKGVDPISVRIDMEDEAETKTIFDEARKPGELIEATGIGRYPTATFLIYFDGELVRKKEARAPKKVSENTDPEVNQ